MQSKSKSQVLESHQIDISVWYRVLLYLNLYALLSLLKWYLSASQLFIKGDNWCDYFFLPLSLLLVQQSILVGLVFFRVHRAIYLLWRIQGENLHLALRAECCDAEQLQPLWEPIPGAWAGPSVLSPAPARESEDLVCQRRVSHPWSHMWTRGLTPWPWLVTSTITLPPCHSSAGCPWGSSHTMLARGRSASVPSEVALLISKDTVPSPFWAEFGSA